MSNKGFRLTLTTLPARQEGEGMPPPGCAAIGRKGPCKPRKYLGNGNGGSRPAEGLKSISRGLPIGKTGGRIIAS